MAVGRTVGRAVGGESTGRCPRSAGLGGRSISTMSNSESRPPSVDTLARSLASSGLPHPLCVDIAREAKTHYHKKLTEIYLVLEGEGQMELDGELVPVKPMTAIFIKPGCRHRAVGNLRIVNIPVPAFDPHDEWFD